MAGIGQKRSQTFRLLQNSRRTKGKGDEEIKPVRANAPPSTCRLEFLFLDLADLSRISTFAKNFLQRADWMSIGTCWRYETACTKQNKNK
jgi:hypothetical protein